jgi:outer membrane lipoprotein SlyB
MRKLIIAAGILAVAAPVLMSPAVAKDRYDNGRYERYYDRDGNYDGPTWRDREGRMHCRRPDGTTGLIVGAAAGALVGRSIDRHGERATGTIVGAVAGALVGREVDRGNRCR